MVAGDEVREMELGKLTQELGEESSGRPVSGPNCIWEGTTCRGLASETKLALSASKPVFRLYPDQYICESALASSRSRQESTPTMAPVAWDPFRKAEVLPLTSKLDMCDDRDSEDPLDLLEFTLDMACPPVETGVSPAAAQALSVVRERSNLDPLGVVWPDVMMYSSASPEWDDPLSGKS